jgi:hypothetical protein
VRAFLNDPRQGKHGGEAFHFGIDVAALDGTAVYACEAGKLILTNALTVSVVTDGGGRELAYWHVRHVFTAADDRKHVVKGELLGYIEKGWGHVHLSEKRGGKWINPLRSGGIAPFYDGGAPKVVSLAIPQPANGNVDIVVNAFDHTPIRVPYPHWGGMPVGVGLLRWRVLGVNDVVAYPPNLDWSVGVDLREAMLAPSLFHQVFAPGTLQNHPDKPGTYNYFLAHGWNTRVLPNGAYTLEVEVSDVRGNTSTKRFPITVTN